MISLHLTFFNACVGQNVKLTHNFPKYGLFAGFTGKIISLDDTFFATIQLESNQTRCKTEERRLKKIPIIFIPIY